MNKFKIVTDIVHNNNVKNDERYYSLDGKQTAIPQRGLNIIRMNDGTTKKVFVK